MRALLREGLVVKMPLSRKAFIQKLPSQCKWPYRNFSHVMKMTLTKKHSLVERLGLTNLIPTTLTLQMADHSRIKPIGLLMNIHTLISSHNFKTNYVVFQLPSSTLSYPILLGRPWLFDAKAKNDWGRRTLTIGKGQNKIVLQMYLVQYNCESQLL